MEPTYSDTDFELVGRMVCLDMFAQAVPRLEGARADRAAHARVEQMPRLHVMRYVGLEDGALVAHSADPLPAHGPKHPLLYLRLQVRG